MHEPKTVLLTGATGYVGGKLLPALLEGGHTVRCLVRDPASDRARALPGGVELVEGDVLTGAGLAEGLRGADAALYLVHSMGAGGDGDFAERDRRAAATFGDEVRKAGVARTIYLGGLEGGDASASEHLRSRHECALELRGRVPELVYVRAAMIVGDGSASFQMLKGLVEHLPVMITPRWLNTRSQPVAIEDVVETLRTLVERDAVPGEVQLGGADVLTYRQMVERFANLEGRRRPLMIPVPLFTTRLSSYWVALVTPVALGLVKPLVDGLTVETVVQDPPPAGINDGPLGFDAAVRQALS